MSVMEYKNVAVGGVSQVKDEGDGVVVAYVSVTGVEDNVADIIEPGAYKRTLTKRIPKGVWGHQWTTPTSKTLDATELRPGDPDLPKKLSDGTPWPKEAGALRIKMQFNLNTARGREAYSDVQFFGDQQEWSIGYTVPKGASYKDALGRRHIKDLDLYEYSAVLFGAMSHARTAAPTSVKDAQLANKVMHGISVLELKSLEDQIEQFRKDLELVETVDDVDFEGDGPSDMQDGASEETDDAVPSDDDDLAEEEVEEEMAEQEEKHFVDRLTAGMSLKDIRSTYNMLGKLLSVVEPVDNMNDLYEIGTKALVEAKAIGYDTIGEAVDAIDVPLEPAVAAEMKRAADDLDAALSRKDDGAAQESATRLMDALEAAMDANADDDLSLKAVARSIADKTSGTQPGDDDEEDDSDYADDVYGSEDGDDEEPDMDEDDEANTDKRKKRMRRMKSLTYEISGVEYKLGPWAGRRFGGVVGGSDLDRVERVEAFVGCVPNNVLSAMNVVLGEIRGNVGMKRIVHDEISTRTVAGLMTKSDGYMKPSKKTAKKTSKTAKKTAKRAVQMKEGRGNTIPGTDSFPINNVGQLKDAIQAYGRAKDKDKARRHIMTRAKALGHEELIPDDWKVVLEVDTVEIKSLESFLDGLA